MKLDNCHTATRHAPDTDCSLSHDSFFTHSITVLLRRASHTQRYFSVSAALCHRFGVVLFSICPLKLRPRLTSCRCLQKFPPLPIWPRVIIFLPFSFLLNAVLSSCASLFVYLALASSTVSDLAMLKIAGEKKTPQEDACNIACDGAFCGHLAY